MLKTTTTYRKHISHPRLTLAFFFSSGEKMSYTHSTVVFPPNRRCRYEGTNRATLRFVLQAVRPKNFKRQQATLDFAGKFRFMVSPRLLRHHFTHNSSPVIFHTTTSCKELNSCPRVARVLPRTVVPSVETCLHSAVQGVGRSLITWLTGPSLQMRKCSNPFFNPIGFVFVQSFFVGMSETCFLAKVGSGVTHRAG